MRTRAAVLAAAMSVGVLVTPEARAAWPQWGGPTRDFSLPAGRLTWPASGPREVWSRALGEGYSAIVTDGPVLYTMYRPVKGLLATMMERLRGTTTAPEVVVALDSATGRTLWEHVYDAPALSGMNLEYGPGPHATPLLAGERLFTVGSTGRLFALDRRTGRVLWEKDLWGGLGGPVQGRGYSSSPLAHGANVIVPVGGPGQALVAFDQATGKLAWKGGSVDLSPASPMVVPVDGQEQLILFHADGIAGFDPRHGALLWNHGHRTDYGLNISTPVWAAEGGTLFLSSAYSGGSKGLRLARTGDRTTVTQLWDTSRMRVHFGTAARIGDTVYGSSGDFGPAVLTAIDMKTGAVGWQERGFARANVVRVGQQLLLLDEDGTLALATPGPGGLLIHGRQEVLGKAWTVPTVDGARVYVRDRETIKALELQ